MTHGHDLDDEQLLDRGDYATLVAGYYDVIVQRCTGAVAGPAGWDVAHNVVARLLGELERGKRYRYPYRVIVHAVITFTIKDHFQNRATHVQLPEEWDPATTETGFRDAEADYDLARLFETLPPTEREVCELRYIDGREIDEIATLLGKRRGAIDVALHRAHAKLRDGDAG